MDSSAFHAIRALVARARIRSSYRHICQRLSPRLTAPRIPAPPGLDKVDSLLGNGQGFLRVSFESDKFCLQVRAMLTLEPCPPHDVRVIGLLFLSAV